MRFASLGPRSVRALRFLAPITALLALCLACMTEVEGDRAMSGTCPAGETCSDATPMGLRFVGNAMFDQDVLQLGPVVVGGTFDVGLRTGDGAPLPPFAFSVEDGALLGATRGEGVFGPTDAAGRPLHLVDGFVTLSGFAPGTTTLRITDPATGALYDRLTFDVFEITDATVAVAQDPTREHLYAGCEEMIAVRLLASDGESEIRVFDQSVVVIADGGVQDEPRFWDCVVYTVPPTSTEVELQVTAAGRTFTRVMPVASLESDGRTTCPEIRRD